MSPRGLRPGSWSGWSLKAEPLCRERKHAGTGVIIVKKECTTLLGQRKVMVKTRGEVETGGWEVEDGPKALCQ
ncbi:hypothetical protein PBY51_024036 [Eleginops maclovinus]|uniref:Uncharacterized protein n=1 Tax=Eleginops maclovinus TaxID=56733 RepID=A0AAN8AR69_ELEMC|nr:hypothetical protein PBY51_024036 [Eleginops maclovinus]